MDNFEFENKKKKKLRREPLYILLCLMCLVIGAGGGYFYRGTLVNEKKSSHDQIYDQIAQAIESDFLDTTDSQETLQERMLQGMIAAIGDPHSSYLSALQAQDLTTSINGSFQGIGVTFTTLDIGAVVLDVYKGTPADKAGLLSGDIITHVQGTSIAGYTSDKIKSVIQGENGSEVLLKVLRNGKPEEVTAIRGNVETSVSYEVRTAGKEKVGYLRMTTFGDSSQTLIEEALKNFESQNIDNLVIDLRGNGGGYLNAAQQILDLFIDDGEVLVRVQNKNGKEEVYKATQRKKYQFKYGFILVNGDSASASEVMTGALKEHLQYKVVGTKTYGKGTVQTQKTLSDSSVLKYTHAKWLTPGGTWVNGKGIEPDYEVKVTTINDFHVGEFQGPYRYDQVNVNIQYMQDMLKELGYAVDRTDGYFSLKTQEALKAFEKKYELSVNGIYDKNDATILLSALTYHVYQQLEDKQYLKINELIK